MPTAMRVARRILRELELTHFDSPDRRDIIIPWYCEELEISVTGKLSFIDHRNHYVLKAESDTVLPADPEAASRLAVHVLVAAGVLPGVAFGLSRLRRVTAVSELSVFPPGLHPDAFRNFLDTFSTHSTHAFAIARSVAHAGGSGVTSVHGISANTIDSAFAEIEELLGLGDA